MCKWKIASSYIIGSGHISKNMPCQDRTYQLVDKSFIFTPIFKKRSKFRKPIKTYKKTYNTFYGLSLADGAGSCVHSDIGAEMVTKKILKYLNMNFEFLLREANPSQKIVKYLEEELTKRSTNNNIDFKDLSSTLLFVAIKDKRFIIGHIGDGVIGMLDKDNNLKTISKPDNGEFSNSTFFTTSIKYKDRLRIIKGTLKSAIGFILMSDGSEESLYDKQKQCLAEANKTIINWLKDNNEQDVEKALFSNLEQVISKQTSDDCSIGIMRQV